MIDVTDSMVKHVDYLRSRWMDGEPELLILIPGAERGYLEFCRVSGGWTLEDLDFGRTQVLIIVEHGIYTRDVLSEARLFSINNKVYEIDDQLTVHAPSQNSRFKEWKFAVKPTGEDYP